jgi:hypothetical protein
MQRIALAATIFLAFSCPSWATNSKDCPYSADELSKQLGKKLKVIHQARGLLGNACEYTDDKRAIKISVDAGPNPAPSAELWRKMANPPGTKWKSVPNDSDKAVTLESYPNGNPYPSIVYEHKGWLVQINVMGVSGSADVALWNTNLLKLKRLPE